MGLEAEKNTCFRGCCSSDTIPLHLPPSSFSLVAPIAKGSESTVYEARVNARRVAAKKPVLSTSEDLDKYHRQLQLLCNLYHPGLVRLVAAHARPPNYLLFFEFYESGNLAEKLHVEEWNPSIDEVLVIANGTAKALQYLHNLGIVHRDIKPANIMLDSNLHPHVADFGLATYKKDLKHVCTENWRSSGKPTGGFHKKNMVGTLIYMAPEILRKDIHTEKSDVYSFGIMINELLTGVVPYTDLRTEAQAHTVLEMNYTEQQLTAAIASEGLRPALADSSSAAPSSLLTLIQRCWAENPLDRPSFDEIIEELMLMTAHEEGTTQKEKESDSTISTEQRKLDVGQISEYQEKLNWLTQGDQLSRTTSSSDSKFAIWHSLLSYSHAYKPALSWGSFATCGRRETMEDTHFMLPEMCNEKEVHLFGIFDGHRGAAAAEFSARALPGFLQTLGSNRSPSDALVEAFVKTDAAFRNELILQRNLRRVAKKDWHPGCTAIAALIIKDRLYVANAGDCRTILCHNGRPIPLTRDHVATCPDERSRVAEHGVEVKWQMDTWRIGPAALQVTRSIGDDDLKPAVTAEPEVTETLLSVDDEYMVMASDGLWDVMSNEDVASIIRDTVKEPGMCSKRLATEAAARGKWTTCALSFEPLAPPCVMDRLGNLFNKESLVEALLQKKIPKEFAHIRGLKDMTPIHLSGIPGKEKAETRFQCPITGLEFNGKYGFFALRGCGHVLSAKALKEVKSSVCLVCHREFSASDKFVINGSTEEVKALRERMEEERGKLREKKEKKEKKVETCLSGTKHLAEERNDHLENGGGKATVKRFRAIDIAPANATKEVYASIFTSSRKSDFKETYSCRSLPLGRN